MKTPITKGNVKEFKETYDCIDFELSNGIVIRVVGNDDIRNLNTTLPIFTVEEVARALNDNQGKKNFYKTAEERAAKEEVF